MKVETYKCDGCGRMKGETNHWWVLMQFFARMPGFQVFAASPEAEIEREGVYESWDFCGETCLMKKISELLGAKPNAAEMAEGRG